MVSSLGPSWRLPCPCPDEDWVDITAQQSPAEMEQRIPNEQRVLPCTRRIRGASELCSQRQEIADLTPEDERETKQILSTARSPLVAGGQGDPGITRPPGTYTGCNESTDAPLRKKMSPSEAETPNITRSGHEHCLSPLPRPPSPQRAVTGTTNMSRVEVVGRAVTSMGLADAVEAELGSPGTTFADQPVGHAENEVRRRDTHVEPLLWSLVIRQCQLPSLLPVAGLLHHLDGLVSLGLQEISGLALAGVERVLADATCLISLTIRRCGVIRLPRLQSGSIEMLDLSDNVIEDTSGLETLFRLRELNLSGNNIRTLSGVRSLVPLGAGSLRELNLNWNPLEHCPRYCSYTGLGLLCF